MTESTGETMPQRDVDPSAGSGLASVPAGGLLPASATPATSRGEASWVVLGIVGVTCVTLAVLLTSGLSFANEAGQPFGVPAVAITPTSSSPVTPSASPSPDPTRTPTHGDPEVVDAPVPVTVDLDDEGDENGSKGNSGSSGTSGGSGSNGSGSNGSDSSGSGSNGSGSSGGSGKGSGNG